MFVVHTATHSFRYIPVFLAMHH
ncbi:MAG: CRISPR-associated DxTHG motif protein [Bacteroidaceae bacterium]|nr:CRISPR-associated DxTHG motif protein [Bacteroidaceae bacterium]MBQ3189592.1 CRISPR-associated DxTHG motif protein [Bacteroidaceae bacterium]